MIKLNHIYILAHAALWVSAYLILSPQPLGLVELEMGFLSERGVSWFLLYEFAVKILFVYSYAHWALPTYLRRRTTLYFLGINLSYFLVFCITDWLISRWVLYPDSPNPSLDYTEMEFKLGVMQLVIHAFLLIFANLYGFAYAWFRERNLRRILDKEKLRTELEALRHQIHPHFLFNSLNSLYGLAFIQGAEQTAEGIARLAHMMRYMIYETSVDFVPLDKEIAYIKSYLDLQKLRIGHAVDVDFQIEGTTEHKQIAPLLFIPFIENAFKYGVSKLNDSYIHIIVKVASGRLEFSVHNSVHQRSSGDPSYSGVGLVNVRQRLALIYPNSHQLEVIQKEDAYLVHLLLDL